MTLEELVIEQCHIITANVWHIPPEYVSRNVILNAAQKLREAVQPPHPAEAATAPKTHNTEKQLSLGVGDVA